MSKKKNKNKKSAKVKYERKLKIVDADALNIMDAFNVDGIDNIVEAMASDLMSNDKEARKFSHFLLKLITMGRESSMQFVTGYILAANLSPSRSLLSVAVHASQNTDIKIDSYKDSDRGELIRLIYSGIISRSINV